MHGKEAVAFGDARRSMRLEITPGKLSGQIIPPPSKSQAHRLIISAALAEGESFISNVSFSNDIIATIRCMEALGAEILCEENALRVRGIASKRKFEALPRLDCGESGSTLRFLIPIALVVSGGAVFVGHGKLMERPQRPYFDLFQKMGIHFKQNENQLIVKGRLSAGEYRLAGDVSSQFFSGLMFALPLLSDDSTLVSTTPLESAAYLDMTIEALRTVGADIKNEGKGIFRICGHAHFAPFQRKVEADWSQAGFFLAARGIGNPITLRALNQNSTQGDAVAAIYCAQLQESGAVTLDVSQCPDLVPALALQAALREGEMTTISGAARLRIKESDRLATVTSELRALGAQIEERADSLVVRGVSALSGGVVDSHNDHRIAMMLAMAATRATDVVILKDAGSVSKSYPHFWRDYQRLGGKILEVSE